MSLGDVTQNVTADVTRHTTGLAKPRLHIQFVYVTLHSLWLVELWRHIGFVYVVEALSHCETKVSCFLRPVTWGCNRRKILPTPGCNPKCNFGCNLSPFLSEIETASGDSQLWSENGIHHEVFFRAKPLTVMRFLVRRPRYIKNCIDKPRIMPASRARHRHHLVGQ
jgi:hypothetical protein